MFTATVSFEGWIFLISAVKVSMNALHKQPSQNSVFKSFLCLRNFKGPLPWLDQTSSMLAMEYPSPLAVELHIGQLCSQVINMNPLICLFQHDCGVYFCFSNAAGGLLEELLIHRHCS